jgi:hypothetical protein
MNKSPTKKNLTSNLDLTSSYGLNPHSYADNFSKSGLCLTSKREKNNKTKTKKKQTKE